MPTSNGQVTSRDLRQGSVRTLHVVDENVTEPKLAAQAVTIDKLSDAVSFARVSAAINSEGTLTTTPTEFVVVTIDVPAWAGEALIKAEGRVQVSTGATARTLVYRLALNDPDPAIDIGSNQTLPANSITNKVITDTWSITTPGSTITVGFWSHLSSGSESSFNQRVQATAWFLR